MSSLTSTKWISFTLPAPPVPKSTKAFTYISAHTGVGTPKIPIEVNKYYLIHMLLYIVTHLHTALFSCPEIIIALLPGAIIESSPRKVDTLATDVSTRPKWWTVWILK